MLTMRWARHQQGFTLLEIMVAFSVAALLMAVSVPATNRMYQSMVYRSAVGDVKNTLETARYQALIQGKSIDVLINPRAGEIALGGAEQVLRLPDALSVDVTSAAELQRDSETAVIRFYPDGSSSGGRISLMRSETAGVALEVGWLLGEITQHRLTDEW